MSSDNVMISGDINAPLVSIKCKNLTDSIGNYKNGYRNQTIIVNLKEFADKVFKNNYIMNKP
jgi:hypothetical protein